MYIRLTRKLAETLNGVDLRDFAVGQVINLKASFARMLVAEGWAEPVVADSVATAADRSPRPKRARPETV